VHLADARLSVNFASDGKRRALEAGSITLPAATGWLLGLGATLAGLLLLPAVVVACATGAHAKDHR